MKALVVGYGSIGARHARVLCEMGCQTAVVSSRDIQFSKVYRTLEQAFSDQVPDYVVVANQTNQHFATAEELTKLGFSGVALIEKPLFANSTVFPLLQNAQVFVAYNLRFHPLIQELREILRNEEVLSVQAYVGQYLPLWRPQADYRDGYSAHRKQGGGALRDLSHELDYLTWILGGWNQVTALGGHLSDLEISSDDIFSLLLTTKLCPIVSLQMNYLDRYFRRFVIVNTNRRTVQADLAQGILTINKDSRSFSVERDSTYRNMHQAVLGGARDILCTLEEGLQTMALIEAAEIAAENFRWVVNPAGKK